MEVPAQDKPLPSQSIARRHKLKLALLLLPAMAFSVAAFVTLDWFRSAGIQHRSQSTFKPSSCGIPDPVRDHALQAQLLFRRAMGP